MARDSRACPPSPQHETNKEWVTMKTKILSRATLLLGIGLVAAVIAVQHYGALPPQVPEADAIWFPGWPLCAGGLDPTRTSTLRVLHVYDDSDPVAPDTQDVWNVTATYSPSAGPPYPDTLYYATITVTNDGNGYSVSCTGCTTTPFVAVGICDPTECASGTDYEYTIKLDMLQADLFSKQIRLVDYDSSSIDDGDSIDSNCDTVRSVSPTSEEWSDTDQTFPCSYDCTNDTLITITYE